MPTQQRERAELEESGDDNEEGTKNLNLLSLFVATKRAGGVVDNEETRRKGG
jgi:hypothetical protein